ncbi:arylsulfatase [Spizellomyces sp. 'palustris']|nr:arylsulfatase [Spizellomyces sp. 'palustris']
MSSFIADSHLSMPTAICCPSRVSILRGQLAHNHNFTDVFAPHGGYERFLEKGLNEEYLPKWLQGAGYDTYYIGKFLNGYGLDNYQQTPGGWNVFDALVNPWIYDYFHSVFSRNGAEPRHYPGWHQVDVITEKALDVLESHLKASKEKPFFLYLAPTAPHTTVAFPPDATDESDIIITEALPAVRHQHLFPNVKAPRVPNFNTANVEGKPRYINQLPLLNDSTIETLDRWYRQRLRTLQSVDELLDSVVKTLEENGALDNTYIFLTADNGYHIGTHRLNAGKTTPYEEDVNVPFIVRGPGVRKGAVNDKVNTHTDIATTLLQLASASLPPIELDGIPIPIHESDSIDDEAVYESFNVEFWRPVVPELYNIPYALENNYRSVRIVAPDYSFLYTVWCTGHRELYNHTADPYQLHNIYETVDGRVLQRLDALLLALHECKGKTCIQPWEYIHKAKHARTLRDALSPSLDPFYEKHQRRLRINACLDHYERENEIVESTTSEVHGSSRLVLQGPGHSQGQDDFVVAQNNLNARWGRAIKGRRYTHPRVRKLFEPRTDIEEYGVPLTVEEVKLGLKPNAYDYD